MSQLYIETDSLNMLAVRLQQCSAKLQETWGIPFICKTKLSLALQYGMNMEKYKDDLTSVSAKIKSMAGDLEKFSEALRRVTKYANDADLGVVSLLQGIPKYVLSGEKLIGPYDITRDFLSGRNYLFDSFAVAWSGDWIDNIKGVAGNVWSKITGADAHLWDTQPEKIVKNSLEKLIASILKDERYLSQFSDRFQDSLKPEEYTTVMKFIKTSLSAGKTITETQLAELLSINVEDVRESDMLKILLQQDNLNFLKEVSDKLDETVGCWDDAVEALEVSTEILKKVFTDYSKDIFILETIRQSLMDCGYNNETVNSVINQMIFDYKNNVMSALLDGIEKLADMSIDEVIKLAGGSTLTTFLAVKDISSTLTGLSDQTDALSMVYATQQYSYALVEQYEYYADKIRSGSYDQGDINQCNLYFELARNAKLQEYRSIKELYENALNSYLTFPSKEEKETVLSQIEMLEKEINKLENM